LFQIGCPNCGFSYCSKCLKLKTAVPKLGNVVHKVCKSCYAALFESGGIVKSPKEEYSSPVSLLKLVLFFLIKRKCISFPCSSLLFILPTWCGQIVSRLNLFFYKIAQELISIVSFKVLLLGNYILCLLIMPPSFRALHEVHCLRLGKCVLQFCLLFVVLNLLFFNAILNCGKRKKSCGTKHGE